MIFGSVQPALSALATDADDELVIDFPYLGDDDEDIDDAPESDDTEYTDEPSDDLPIEDETPDDIDDTEIEADTPDANDTDDPDTSPEVPDDPVVPGPHTVILKEDSTRALVNDTRMIMDDPITRYDDALFLSIEQIRRLFDAVVRWNGTTLTIEMDGQTIAITNTPNVQPIQEIERIPHVELEYLADALGVHIHIFTLDTDADAVHFAVIRDTELSLPEARALAQVARWQLVMPEAPQIPDSEELPTSPDGEPISDGSDDAATEDDAVDGESAAPDAPLMQLDVAIPPELMDRTVVVQINNTRALVDGEYIIMIEPALLPGTRTLIPIGSIAELMGADVTWNYPTMSVEMGNHRLEMDVGSYYLRRWLDGARILPDVHIQQVLIDSGDFAPAEPIQLFHGTPYAPMGVLALALGGFIEWYHRSGLGGGFAIASLRELTDDELADLVNEAIRRLDPDYVYTTGISVAQTNEHLSNARRNCRATRRTGTITRHG